MRFNTTLPDGNWTLQSRLEQNYCNDRVLSGEARTRVRVKVQKQVRTWIRVKFRNRGRFEYKGQGKD